MNMSDKACHLFVARSNDGDKKQESNEPVPCMPRTPLFFAHYPLFKFQKKATYVKKVDFFYDLLKLLLAGFFLSFCMSLSGKKLQIA